MLKLEYLIYIYISLCFCMMIFNVFYIIYNRTTEKSSEKEKNKLTKKMSEQINLIKNNFEVTAKHRRYLYNKLKRIHNLMIFERFIDKQDERIKEDYLENIKYVFYDLAIYYKKSDSIKKAYFAYIVGKYRFFYDIENNAIIKTLDIFLEDESLYCRDNSLKAIIKYGNTEDIIRALNIINETKYYYDTEIIFQNLLEFDGNKMRLSAKLWMKFNTFNENIQIAIIRYIDKEKLDYNEQFYKLLVDEKVSNNIKIEIVKYYKNNIYGPAEKILIEDTKLTGMVNKELVQEAARTLRKYNSYETKEALKALLKKKDWNTKMVASESLSVLEASYYELIDIYNGEDETTREILKYKVQSHKYTVVNKEKEVR